MLPFSSAQKLPSTGRRSRPSNWHHRRVFSTIAILALFILLLSIASLSHYTFPSGSPQSESHTGSRTGHATGDIVNTFPSPPSVSRTRDQDEGGITSPSTATISPHSPSAPEVQLRPHNAPPEAVRLEGVKAKHAFATFLVGSDEDLEYEYDKYLIATRILAFQLLHAESTRSRDRSIPFIVLVTDKVKEASRERLRKDGAVVLRVPGINADWLRPNRASWRDVMTKLRLWELVDFERIAFLDADHILVKPLDDVFSDPASEERPTLPIEVAYTGGEPSPAPSTYVFAGNAEGKFGHHYPPKEDGRDWRVDFLNAGFFVLKPDLVLMRHYLSIMNIPDAFKSGEPEQNLLNLVHSRNGSMPWHQISTDFDVHYPNLGDIWAGVKSVHEKWWAGQPDQTDVVRGEIGRDPRETELMGPWMEGWRWRMERFFDTVDKAGYGP